MKRVHALFIALAALVLTCRGATMQKYCNVDSDCCIAAVLATGQNQGYYGAICLNGTCMVIQQTNGRCMTSAECALSTLTSPWACLDIQPDYDCISMMCVYASKSPPVIAAAPGQCPPCYEFVPFIEAACVGWGQCVAVTSCCCTDMDCDLCYACDKKSGKCLRKPECCTNNDDCERTPDNVLGRLGDVAKCVMTSQYEGVCQRGTKCVTHTDCIDDNPSTTDVCLLGRVGCCRFARNGLDECVDAQDCRGWGRDVGQRCAETAVGTTECKVLDPSELPPSDNCNRPDDCAWGLRCCGGGKCSKADGTCPGNRDCGM